jgi:hypothetical protein
VKRLCQYLFFFAIAVVCLIASCSKGGDGSGAVDDGSGGGPPHVFTPTDTTAPVLDIYTPTTNQVFTNGNVITVTGKIADDLGLYQGTIRIVNDANGDVLKQQQYEIHGVLSYNFNIAYTTAITAPSDYTVTVTFNDHGLNSTTKSVKVKVNL